MIVYKVICSVDRDVIYVLAKDMDDMITKLEGLIYRIYGMDKVVHTIEALGTVHK